MPGLLLSMREQDVSVALRRPDEVGVLQVRQQVLSARPFTPVDNMFVSGGFGLLC